MRKLFLGLATLPLLLVASSCMKETSESAEKNSNKVTFKAALGKQTLSKATEFTYWGNADELNVYSFQTGSTTAFETFTLTYDEAGPSWNYGTPVLSAGVPIRYYSFYPATASLLTNTPGVTADSYSFGYTVASDPDVQEDLIAATVTTVDPNVTLPFNHILSQVNFAIVKTFGMAIEITDIKVNGVKNKGTYTFSSGWDLTGATIQDSYVYTPAGTSNVTDGLDRGISYMGNTGNISIDAKNDNPNALMLMPQEFTDASDGTITFKFRLTTKDDAGEPVYVPAQHSYQDVTVDLCDFNSQTWLPGKRYLYQFDFSSYLEGVQQIVFKVVVNNWEDGQTATDNIIAETLQVTDANGISIERAVANHSAANALNPNLKTFPIAVTPALTTPLCLALIDGFDEGDKIKIEFVDAGSANKFENKMNPANWTAEKAGRVWTFTCVAPLKVAAPITASIADPFDVDAFKTGIEDAITLQNDEKDSDTALGGFPITVKEVFSGGNISIDLSGMSHFVAGDCIRIECPNNATASRITITLEDPSVWALGCFDNIVVFTKN